MNITRLVTGPLSVNTWFIPVDSRRMVVVDPGGSINAILAHLAALEAVPALVVLTHGHFDHLIALPALKEKYPSLEIAVHPADRHFLGFGALARHRSFFERLGAPSFTLRYPDEIPDATSELSEGTPISLNDGTVLADWKILHTPGHSKGSVCLFNAGEKILVSGDTLFCSGFGRTDGPGGNQDELEKSLLRLFTLGDDITVLPGHGEMTTLGRERHG